MKRAWVLLGRMCFWLALPLLHVYLKLRTRTRILVITGNKVLVVRGWLSDGSWSLPGGGLHRNEKPETGVVRELQEETGIAVSAGSIQKLGIATQKQHWLNFKYHQFCVSLPTSITLKPQRWEIVETKWLPIEKLNEETAQRHVLDTIEAWRLHR